MKRKVEKNPFLLRGDFKVTVRPVKTYTNGRVNSESGRKTEEFSHRSSKLIDIESSCKLYRLGGFLEQYNRFSVAGKDLLVLIMMKLRNGQDYIELKSDVYYKEFGKSDRTFRAAKKELMNIIIAKRSSRKDTYWVNPGVLFAGDRVNAFPDYVRVVERKAEQYNANESLILLQVS